MDEVVVIIPALNAADTLPRQLAALDAQTDLDFRVIVSDNGSTDGTRELCLSWTPRFRSIQVVDASRARGAATARNAGVEASAEPTIVFCDADDRVDPGWVAAMRAALVHADGATGPLYLFQREQLAETWNADALPLAMGFRPYLPSCNMGVTRAAFDLVGGFDTTLHMGQEDVDLGWRLAAAGARLVHAPEAIIEYHQRDTTRQYIRQQYRSGRAYVALYVKHRDVAPPPVSVKASLRWFWEWVKQYRPRRGLRALGGPAFHIGRLRECMRRRTLSPL